MNEIWKDIVGYEGLYQVSNLGRVRKSSGEILSQTTHRAKYTNYRTVGLRKNRRGRRCKGYTIARMDKEDEHDKHSSNPV